MLRLLIGALALLFVNTAAAQPALDGESVARLINEHLLARKGNDGRLPRLVALCDVHEDARFTNGSRRLLAACRYAPATVRGRPPAMAKPASRVGFMLTVEPAATGWRLTRLSRTARIEPLHPA